MRSISQNSSKSLIQYPRTRIPRSDARIPTNYQQAHKNLNTKTQMGNIKVAATKSFETDALIVGGGGAATPQRPAYTTTGQGLRWQSKAVLGYQASSVTTGRFARSGRKLGRVLDPQLLFMRYRWHKRVRNRTLWAIVLTLLLAIALGLLVTLVATWLPTAFRD